MGKKRKIDHFCSHDAITYIPNMPITNSYHSQPPFQVRLNSNHLLITEASVQEEHGIHTHKKKPRVLLRTPNFPLISPAICKDTGCMQLPLQPCNSTAWLSWRATRQRVVGD